MLLLFVAFQLCVTSTRLLKTTHMFVSFQLQLAFLHAICCLLLSATTLDQRVATTWIYDDNIMHSVADRNVSCAEMSI